MNHIWWQNRASELPTVLLGLRAATKDDTGFSHAEILYGETLRLPGDMFGDCGNTPDNEANLRKHILNIPKRHSESNRIFVHPQLTNCEKLFLRYDRVTKPIVAPYTGPHMVLKKTDKHFVIENNNTRHRSIAWSQRSWLIAMIRDVPITVTQRRPPKLKMNHRMMRWRP